MHNFKIRTEILEYDSLKDFISEDPLGCDDLVLTNRFIIDKHKELFDNVKLIYQEDYGAGEPNDEMIDAIKDDMPNGIKRIIAIGGGSIIDIAKFLLIDYDGTLDDILIGDTDFKKTRSLYVIPTTVGTGSEVTNVAITELKKRKSKKGLANDLLYPDKAILVSDLVSTLPYKVFATSSLDALIHAIESFLSPKANELTRLFSKEAIKDILNGYMYVRDNGLDHWKDKARTFLLASNMAGIAFGNAGCALIHALSYPLGAKYHIAHGEANGLLFERVIKFYMDNDNNSQLNILEKYLKEVLMCDDNGFKNMFELINVIIKRKALIEYGVTVDDLEPFVDIVINSQQRLLNNNYIKAKRQDMLMIYKDILDK